MAFLAEAYTDNLQLEAKPSAKWLRFKDESGFADEKPTTGKLIYTVKNYLQRQKDD
jgi:hypothetical protein